MTSLIKEPLPTRDGEHDGASGGPLTIDSERIPPTMQYASLLRRGVAYLLDLLLLCFFVLWRTGGFHGDGEHDALLKVVPAIYLLVYFPLAEGFLLHATLGKLLCGIKVVDRQGHDAQPVRAFCRSLLKVLLGPLTLFFGWIFAGVHPRGQSIHDLLARTCVVRRQGSSGTLIAPADHITA